MSIAITLLWLLGIAFLAILWMGFAASIIEIGYGILVRRGVAARFDGARERTFSTPGSTRSRGGACS